ncbi:MAG: TonB-dependent receptor plug domain-containing protein [Candidatus Aminicenantales bacterium]
MIPSLHFPFKRLAVGTACALVFSFLTAPAFLRADEDEQKATEKDQTEKITEEILVVGRAPKAQPVSTVTTIAETLIEQYMPRDLSEAIQYATGVNVTTGSKREATLKLRGMDSRRIVLLIDGVPSYEPYYGSFDLKTVSAAGLDSIQVTKGPSSVLYGPNTLAGIVNVITRRPGENPFLTVQGSLGADKTYSAGLDGGVRLNRFSIVGDAAWQKSDGFSYPDATSGDKTALMNTDYRRFNLNAKVYYTPSDDTEIMINGGVYQSDYGMPPALGAQKARYWYFKNWDRYTLNAGGFTSLGEGATLRFRAFYVNYRNTLDQFKDLAMTIRQFESTFDNSVYGAFALSEFNLASWNTLKVSLNYQKDVARTQDDVGLAFTEYNQGTFSAAVEDQVRLSDQWQIVGGLSLDLIDKFSGGTYSRLNPMIGLKFTPNEDLDLHLSFSQKSRFPNMRAMYSPSGGNPDLLSETGTNAEAGFTWDSGIRLSGAAFLYQFKNMIDSVTLADGTKKSMNVGKAHINGFELQAQKSLGWVEGTLNYTYLDAENDVDKRPLDALSAHNLNFDLSFFPAAGLRFSVYGLSASKSYWFDFSSGKNFDIPKYFNLDAVLAYDFGRFEVFVKATNLFNDYIYTEPIFPWRARFFEIGARINVF